MVSALLRRDVTSGLAFFFGQLVQQDFEERTGMLGVGQELRLVEDDQLRVGFLRELLALLQRRDGRIPPPNDSDGNVEEG